MRQQKVQEAWRQIDALQDKILFLKTNHPTQHTPMVNQGRPYNSPTVPVVPSKTVNTISKPVVIGGAHPPHSGPPMPRDKLKEADLVLMEAERARRDYETKRTGQQQTQLPLHNQPIPSRRSKKYDDSPRREEEAGNILENPLLQGIDKDIQHYANDVREKTRPPPTQEFQQEDDEDTSIAGIPYDPNLTCQGCGKRYRFGEIQKLRRHVNETCLARQYTQPQHKPQDNDEQVTEQNP